MPINCILMPRFRRGAISVTNFCIYEVQTAQRNYGHLANKLYSTVESSTFFYAKSKSKQAN
jgi:hypothetical protein